MHLQCVVWSVIYDLSATFDCVVVLRANFFGFLFLRGGLELRWHGQHFWTVFCLLISSRLFLASLTRWLEIEFPLELLISIADTSLSSKSWFFFSAPSFTAFALETSTPTSVSSWLDSRHMATAKTADKKKITRTFIDETCLFPPALLSFFNNDQSTTVVPLDARNFIALHFAHPMSTAPNDSLFSNFTLLCAFSPLNLVLQLAGNAFCWFKLLRLSSGAAKRLNWDSTTSASRFGVGAKNNLLWRRESLSEVV